MYRTHTCGELNLKHINKKVTLCGWINSIRDKGNILWIDLKDSYGISQFVLEDSNKHKELLVKVRNTKKEYVIQATGTVVKRQKSNKNIKTGDIEILLEKIQVLNKSKNPPFLIQNDTDGKEELRMKYRYLDIRRGPVLNNLKLRSTIIKIIRDNLYLQNFIEVETPCLIKSTPEGARDFLVPSRLHKDLFYALPQSPQTLKQLLMVSSVDRYFQIAKCFRDEDLRADRQPEFSQLDCELSFVSQNEILDIFESLIRKVFEITKNIILPPFKRITYKEAINKYGTDKPDTRFGMEFTNITEYVKKVETKLFDKSQIVVGICAKGCGKFSRKQLDKLNEFVLNLNCNHLIHIKINEDESIKSSLEKFISKEQLKVLCEKFNSSKGDLIMILHGDTKQTLNALSELRNHVADIENLKDKNTFSPLWITEFPLLEWCEDEKRYIAKHHPFTAPVEEDIELLSTSPSEVRANSYDMVINGSEIGGGSIRIHSKKMQEKIFKLIGLSENDYNKQFGALLEALEYGTPPHGGIAFGIARLCSIIGGSNQIRDFIAFPKNNSGKDVMLETPSKLTLIN